MTDETATTPADAQSDDPSNASPNDLSNAPTCPYCGEAFPSERLRDLHRGLEHYDELDDDERDAFDEAYVAETDDLRSFRLRALAALVLLYFVFLFTYALVTL